MSSKAEGLPREAKDITPRWIAQFEIPAGDWMTTVKSSGFRRFMAPTYPLKTNIAANLLLHTQGYQGSEVAVRMDHGELREMTSADILGEIWACHEAHYKADGVLDRLRADAAAAGMSRAAASKEARKQLEKAKPTRQNFRRAVSELEAEGQMERRRASDGTPVRDLTDEESRKLSHAKIHYYFWIQARPVPAGIMRRVYEEKVAENSPSLVVTERLPWDPALVKDIRNAINLFHPPDSPFFHLSKETPEENVILIGKGIQNAAVSFIDTIKSEKPEAFEVVATVDAPVSSPDILPQASAVEPAEISQKGATPEPIVNSETAGGSTQRAMNPPDNPIPDTVCPKDTSPRESLRAGLILRGFHSLDDSGLDQISQELNGTPHERFWLTLEDRLTRGRSFGFKILLQIASTARKNYVASQRLMEQAERQQSDAADRRRQDRIALAQEILAKREQREPGDIQWAEEVLAS